MLFKNHLKLGRAQIFKLVNNVITYYITDAWVALGHFSTKHLVDMQNNASNQIKSSKNVIT